jgi:hypothetical protein
MGDEDANVQITDARFLPIVSAYAARIGLVEEIDRMLPCDMEVSPGRIVLAMILDALTGRTPLFRLGDFFADKDIELLLGEAIPLAKFSDHTLGRVLERLARAGTNKILGAVAFRTMKSFHPIFYSSWRFLGGYSGYLIEITRVVFFRSRKHGATLGYIMLDI